MQRQLPQSFHSCLVESFICRGEELIGPSHGKGRRANKRRGLPPITPNACVKDTVGSQVFDLVWVEVSIYHDDYDELILLLGCCNFEAIATSHGGWG